ncbi:hypothetical protein CHELA1G11_30074 [Hyphomicrobiales bacterium]|nr:hypothetical protein CHELA1G11_30074 [Hyphomicrobiales bacterium]
MAFVDVNLRDGPWGTSISSAVVRETKKPVVFVTANPEAIPGDSACALGAIEKPWRPEVIDKVLHLIDRYGTDPMTQPPSRMILPSLLRGPSHFSRTLPTVRT